ncbi:hypothetical protein FGADI_10722 [Fusarium gaditjirri]|uniref:Heterokaryon incompatibility domain-containing protein n=1 Tax=Fusarium gaditjirri TaxID=282569 RepID=A0A8H4SWJ7_9HYPO|nr:hypothetical protein FGADI_10722 [Fusarium gaditjirri]
MSLDSDSEWVTEVEDSPRLTETDYSAQLTEYAKKRHPGTLNNLFESTEYNTWLGSSPQTLLCSSEPGAGKSVAVACLIQDLSLFRRFDWVESYGNSFDDGWETGGGIAYILFDSLRWEEQSYDNIALCISEQLTSRRQAPPWKDRGNGHFLRPTEVGVSRYLKEQIVCQTELSTVFIVLEGLDECPEPSRVPLLALLAEVQREYRRLNVLLTWRNSWAPACDIELLLKNTRTLEICPSKEEMQLYLTDHLPLMLESRKHINDQILSAANGRYLFAKLYLELTKWTASPHQLDLISSAPSSLATYDDLYNSIMNKISLQSDHQVHLAKHCLPWLAFAKRPLSVLELQEALTISIEGNAQSSFGDSPVDISAVIRSCGGLARLDCINGTSCIRLYDRTIQDFLRLHLSIVEGDVGRACIAYLIKKSPGGACTTNAQLVERLRSNPLYEYAASYWGQHIQRIKGTPMSDATIREFFSNRTRWEGALQAEYAIAEMRRKALKGPCKDGRPYYPMRSETIHLATRTGAASIVAALLEQDGRPSFINSPDYYGHTALSYAAQAGNNEILEVLLPHKALDIDKRDYEGRTPISHAADNGHAFAVSRLLNHRANPNLRDCDGCFPLWYAVRYGHLNAVKVLLDCQNLRELNSTPKSVTENHKRTTPLECALKNGFREIAEMLTEMDGIDAHAPAELGASTVLCFAIKTGHEDIALKLLAKHGIGPSSDNQESRGELLVNAASVGSTKLVNCLLAKHRINPNITYPYGRGSEFEGLTPLMAAAKKRHDFIVKILLQHESIRPDIAYRGMTALSEAAKNGFADIVNVLLADGRVDVNKQNDEGSTPLSLSASGGHEAVVEALLMKKDTDPNCKDWRGRPTILQAMDVDFARWYGLRDELNGVLRRLLADPRIDPNSRDSEGYSLLYYAAEIGATGLVELMLENSKIDMGFEDSNAPLAVAAQWGHVGVVKAFLKTGRFEINTPLAYPNGSSDAPKGPLLSIASESGEMGVVDLLLSQPGIDACETDAIGRTPLAMAASQGQTDVVERLLAVERVDANSRDMNGWTPLHMAMTYGYSVETVQALLRAENINPDAPDDAGRTPLSVLCGSPDNVTLETVNLLLATNGVNPDSRDITGRSPLSWAIDPSGDWEGYSYITERREVIQRLLQIQEVDPNVEDAEGLTPLLRAIMGRNGNEIVRILLEREDLDVQQKNRDGLTPMAAAAKMDDMAVMSLLRKRGAQDDSRDTHVDIPKFEDNSSVDGLDVENPRLPSEDGEPVDSHPRIQPESSSRSSVSSKSISSGIEDELSRDIFLPLSEQQECLITEDAIGPCLCERCATIDLDDVFSRRDTSARGRVIARLGRLDRSWESRECPMCRLIAAMSSRWGGAYNSDTEEEQDCGFVLIALSSTGMWLCQNEEKSWQHFTSRWTDTMFLSVVPDSIRGTKVWQGLEKFDSFVFRAGFIGRLGSNCDNGTSAITITRVGEEVDYAAAKGWIACCRDNHSDLCNHRELAHVPHFRVIDCKTWKIILQGEEVPSYVALSYVWGPLPVDSSRETSASKDCVSEAERDTLELGSTVEAVVEDAIRVTMELGYRFLWVDRYCITQQGDGKMKQEQLQRSRSYLDPTGFSHSNQVFDMDDAGMDLPGRATLSRRRIFFSETEMSFECRNLVAREAMRIPPRVEKLMSHRERRLMAPSWTYGQSKIISRDKGSEDLFERLEEYTRRKLSYHSDALNGMLGILQVCATHETNPVYHVCGVPIIHDSSNKFKISAAGSDGGSHDARVALAGFVSGLCWTLEAPSVRRLEFPTWSWTGWDGVVNNQSDSCHRVSFGEGFDLELSLVKEDGISVMPWNEYYGQLRTAVTSESQSGFMFSQRHTLDITANTAKVQFHEEYNFHMKRLEWKGTFLYVRH